MDLKLSDVEKLYGKGNDSSYRVCVVGWNALRTICKHELESAEKGYAVDADKYKMASVVIKDLLLHGAKLEDIADEIIKVKNEYEQNKGK